MNKILILALVVVMFAAVGCFVFAHHSEGGSSSESHAVLFYDSALNDYFNADGIVVGGQNDGCDINYLRNNPPVITEDGSLE